MTDTSPPCGSARAHRNGGAIAPVLDLANTYQTSRHATIRRYVEDAPRPIGLAVLGRHTKYYNGKPSMIMLQSVESTSFRNKYGAVAQIPPGRLPIDGYELARDAHAAVVAPGIVPVTAGQTTISTPARDRVSMGYEIFSNQYVVFVLLVPNSRLRFIQPRMNAEWTNPPRVRS